ncbi:diaminopimelate epimerase [Alteriqipengyuania lutimaris]|uniref:Diaminopimelate epimerase n=1 Tax=Alteriqipengyuania lutimaris TaxID=1538146 RepID=A0A395LPL4_9SPHN|nr:diaminopimelate epimerase [Alteriqipengyuania lutimaris]RDS78685.1 diaminopimelate epimerase [Alteriqipengyuania lutimaris]
MRVPFIKMHGLGNDFAILDGREIDLPRLSDAQVRALADRHRGIGFDQLILLSPSREADMTMRIHNADGGEVEACGNATRAVAVLHGAPASIQTTGGVLQVRPADGAAEVAMGRPRFGWEEIPLAYAMDTRDMPLGWDMLERPGAANVGNPHVVFFIDDVDAVPLDRLGPEIEIDALFPERINVNVAQVVSRDAIRLRVWERGAGLTLACGTGACATAAVAYRRGLVDAEVSVTLPGGTLTIRHDEDGGIHMSGPATESYRGTFELDDFT